MDHPYKVLKQSTHQLQRKPGNNYQPSNHVGVTQQADLQNLKFPEVPNFSSHRNQPENPFYLWELTEQALLLGRYQLVLLDKCNDSLQGGLRSHFQAQKGELV